MPAESPATELPAAPMVFGAELFSRAEPVSQPALDPSNPAFSEEDFAHVDAFSQSDIDDTTVNTYLELALATADRAEASGRLSVADASHVRQVLTEADWDAMAQIVAGI